MRLGCGGCLSTLTAGLALALVVGAGGWVTVRAVQKPAIETVAYAAEDGVRAQQKIFDLVRRGGRAGSVVLSEAEINAFVARHVDPADLPLRDPVIRLRGNDIADVAGTVTFGRLVHESPLAPAADMLPSAWLARPIWMTINVRVRVTTDVRRTLALDTQRLVIGRQRIPTVVLRLVLDPSSLRLTRLRLPSDVDAVHVEPGRVIIRPTSPRVRT